MRVCVAVLAGLAVFLLAGLESTNAEQGGKCTPGAPLKEIGRPCWCNSRGVVVCSKVLLPNNPGAIKATLPALKEPEEEESECKDGDVWQQECNTCRCIGGHAACTRKQCRGPTRPSDRQDRCADGDTWMEDCNRCRCSGGKKMCTRKQCRRT